MMRETEPKKVVQRRHGDRAESRRPAPQMRTLKRHNVTHNHNTRARARRPSPPSCLHRCGPPTNVPFLAACKYMCAPTTSRRRRLRVHTVVARRSTALSTGLGPTPPMPPPRGGRSTQPQRQPAPHRHRRGRRGRARGRAPAPRPSTCTSWASWGRAPSTRGG